MKESPIDRVRDGNVSASIFRNQNTKTGEYFYSVAIAKNFQDKQTGEWGKTNSYSAADLNKLRNVAELASNRIEAHQRMSGVAPKESQEVQAPTAAQSQLPGQAPSLEDQRNAALSAAQPQMQASDAPQQTAPEVKPQQTR